MTLPSANDSPPSSTHASPSRKAEEKEKTSLRVQQVAQGVKMKECDGQNSFSAHPNTHPQGGNLIGQALFQTPGSSSKQDGDQVFDRRCQKIAKATSRSLGLKYNVQPLDLTSMLQQQEKDQAPPLSPEIPAAIPRLSPMQTSDIDSVWSSQLEDQVDSLLRYLYAQLPQRDFVIDWSNLDWFRRNHAIDQLRVAFQGHPLLDPNKRDDWLSQLDQASNRVQLFL